MHFFRSEEHLRSWEGFREGKKGGMIPLDTLMQLFGLPYFTDRVKPDYVSRFSDYNAELVGALDSLPDAGDFWKLSPFQKTAFKLARKLGFM